ncbi:hypothetical protein AB0383_29430 [Amycolatopsis sp. NPDC051373]|uniref:hypothetical protein n=1 Tax=Amycolatopsis sp. NPDC051373 TaxID=3155801 RepID=UPI00344C51F6
MGHKGIRDGGPPRDPNFRPSDVVGMPIRKAVIELTRHGFLIQQPGAHARDAAMRHKPRAPGGERGCDHRSDRRLKIP